MASEDVGDEYASDFDEDHDGEVVVATLPAPSTSLSGLSFVNYADYSLKSILGGGSFAVIYSATSATGPCAVKVLVDARASSQQKEEFQAELLALSAIPTHSNIVRFLGACTAPKPCFVMELLGKTLGQSIQSGPPRSPDEPVGKSSTPRRGHWPLHCVLSWTADVAAGLAHLHGLSPPILHRDVKSANVLLRHSDGDPPHGRAVLTDFGLCFSKVAAAGTASYMAPELLATMDAGPNASSSSTISRACDVYALGVLLWALLSGEEPWIGWKIPDIKSSVCSGRRPELSKLREDTPPKVKELLTVCWSGKASERPSAAFALASLRAASEVSKGTKKAFEGGETFDALDSLASSMKVNARPKK